jgi:hypothetical protein
MFREEVVDAQGSGSLNSFLTMFGLGGEKYAGMPKAIIYVKAIINLLL